MSLYDFCRPSISHPNVGPEARDAARRAFTLPELLIVIGIIGILVAIIVPAAGKATKMSRNMACQSNLRHLYSASVEFSMTHKGLLPLPVKIPGTEDPVNDPIVLANGSFPLLSIGLADLQNGAYWKYIGSTPEMRQGVVMCPDDASEKQATGSGNANGDRNFSYSFNSMIRINSGANKYITLTRTQCVLPAERIYIMEEVGPNDSYAVMRNDATGCSDDDRPTGRHGNVKNLQYGSPDYASHGLGNFCFFDGHVESLSPAEFGSHTPQWYDPRNSASN